MSHWIFLIFLLKKLSTQYTNVYKIMGTQNNSSNWGWCHRAVMTTFYYNSVNYQPEIRRTTFSKLIWMYNLIQCATWSDNQFDAYYSFMGHLFFKLLCRLEKSAIWPILSCPVYREVVIATSANCNPVVGAYSNNTNLLGMLNHLHLWYRKPAGWPKSWG